METDIETGPAVDGGLATVASASAGDRPSPDPQLAARATRLWARLIDNFVLVGPILIGAALLMETADAPDGTSVAIGIPAVGLIACGLLSVPIQWYVLATRGQSLGKMALGIRIVGADGQVPNWTRSIVAREGARIALAFIPGFGKLASLVNNLMVFTDDRRTLHDHAAGTYVVRATENDSGFEDRRLSQVRQRGAAPVKPLATGLIVGLALLAVTCGVGGTASLAIPNFISMQLKAKRGEVPGYVDGIRAAEVAYHGAYGTYLPVGSRDLALSDNPGKALRPWSGGPDWDQLGWAPDGQVRGAYWVDATDEEFVVTGFCDVDGDGIPAVYQATAAEQAKLSTEPNVF